jgi:hypothetical protein
MNKRTIAHALAVAMVVLALSPVAAKDKFPKPKSNEIVIVARIVIEPSINDEFYAHYADILKDGISNITLTHNKKDEAPSHCFDIFLSRAGKSDYYQQQYSGGKLGEVNYLKRSIPKDRMMEIAGMRIFIFGNPFLYIDLPIFHDINIPEGTNYVYLGTFILKTKDEYFNVSEISQVDEYDAAVKAVERDYGPSAQLVRVNLLDIPEKK